MRLPVDVVGTVGPCMQSSHTPKHFCTCFKVKWFLNFQYVRAKYYCLEMGTLIGNGIYLLLIQLGCAGYKFKNLTFSGLDLGRVLCLPWEAALLGCWLVWCSWGCSCGVDSVELRWQRDRIVRMVSVIWSCVTLAS